MIEGEIILASLPQADGNTKLRPVLLLKELPGHQDFLVCGISTQLRHLIMDFDELIDQTTDNFEQTGLRQSSLIRLGFLAVIPNPKNCRENWSNRSGTSQSFIKASGEISSAIN